MYEKFISFYCIIHTTNVKCLLSFATKPYRAMEFSLCQVPVVSLLDLSMSEVYTDHNLIFFTVL